MAKIDQAIADMIAEVDRNTSVDESASLLLKKLFAIVEANKTDPVALQAAVDKLKASNQALVDAVTANTPADEAPSA